MNPQIIRGTGKRKCSVAQVKLSPGKGMIVINGKPYEEVFPRLADRHYIKLPLLVTDTLGRFDAEVKVNGGGTSGQAQAIRHGIARTLAQIGDQFRLQLRQQGLLTRDSRVKERKKYGLRRARKAPQYTKR